MTRQVTLRVASTGWVTTFQDLGRRDAERLGVPAGGAADQEAAAVANVLVGNGRTAALLESMGGRLAIIPSHDVLVAVTGTPADVALDGTPVYQWGPVVVSAGQELSISGARGGARSYLAVNGALRVERFLGSAAPDARMGFPQTIAADQLIELRTGFRGFPRAFFDQSLFRLPVPVPSYDAPLWRIDLVPGALADRMPAARTLMERSRYTVTDRSNHVGLRLDGPVVHPEDDSEIVSHGVPIGAVEIPHGDELIVLGRYRTLTAGYPIVGFATRRAQSLLMALEDAVASAFSAAGLRTGADPAGADPDPEPEADLHPIVDPASADATATPF
jgi:allophanate hydrolase subunit 2